MNDYDVVFDLLCLLQEEGSRPFFHIHPDYTMGPAFVTASSLGWLSWNTQEDVFLTLRGRSALKGHRRQKQFALERLGRPLT